MAETSGVSPRLTSVQWLICAIAAVGFAFDIYELLMLPLIVAPATTALSGGAIKPGTPEFREALRKALLTERDIAASQGVYNFTEKDRFGLDDRSRIILTVKDGKYVMVK